MSEEKRRKREEKVEEGKAEPNLYFRRLARPPLNRRDKDLITVQGEKRLDGWRGCCEI